MLTALVVVRPAIITRVLEKDPDLSSPIFVPRAPALPLMRPMMITVLLVPHFDFVTNLSKLLGGALSIDVVPGRVRQSVHIRGTASEVQRGS